jgi:hypothetical protein
MLSAPSSPETWRMQRSRGYPKTGNLLPPNAALQTAKMAVACAGYRLASTPGHHPLTFDVARLALGSSAARSLDFLSFSMNVN